MNGTPVGFIFDVGIEPRASGMPNTCSTMELCPYLLMYFRKHMPSQLLLYGTNILLDLILHLHPCPPWYLLFFQNFIFKSVSHEGLWELRLHFNSLYLKKKKNPLSYTFTCLFGGRIKAGSHVAQAILESWPFCLYLTSTGTEGVSVARLGLGVHWNALTKLPLTI